MLGNPIFIITVTSRFHFWQNKNVVKYRKMQILALSSDSVAIIFSKTIVKHLKFTKIVKTFKFEGS